MKSGKRSRKINKKNRLHIGHAVRFKGSDRRGIFRGPSEKPGLVLVRVNSGALVEVPIKNVEKI